MEDMEEVQLRWTVIPGTVSGRPGLDGGHAGQVVLQIGALVVAAPDHIVDEGGVHAGALDQSLHHRDGQVQGGQGLELTADGAMGVRQADTIAT